MKLIMHYPDTEEKQKELAIRVSVFHAKAVIDYINQLPCTYEEKISLLEQIRKDYQITKQP